MNGTDTIKTIGFTSFKLLPGWLLDYLKLIMTRN